MHDEAENIISKHDQACRDALDSALHAYAGQPQFRSAEGHEVIFANPFHRPVRAHDLSFLDFSRPVNQEHVYTLSSLMGNRMLLNIYETDLPIVGEALSQQALVDRAAFYSTNNRILGERVRSMLERHCFDWIDHSASDAERSPTAFIERSVAEFVHSAQAVVQSIETSDSRHRMVQFLAIQICGPLRTRDFVLQGYRVVDLDGHWREWIGAVSGAMSARHSATSALARAAQLSETPHAYWQFYLGSQLAVANYLAGITREPSRFFETIGAIVIDRLCSAQLARCWDGVLVSAFGANASLWNTESCDYSDAPASEALNLLEKVPREAQTEALNAFNRGVRGMCRILIAANEDLGRQIAWAGHASAHRKMAEDYIRVIRDQALVIDMETFVEPSSERSTTHVHDTDRLLVIESGEMDFWHSFGEPLRFGPGDMIFVPKHRLHGSVVTTDQCVYHQPIVSSKLREFIGQVRPTL